MKILGVETSTSNLSVAILDNEKIVGEYNINLKGQASNLLIPSIKNLLKRTKVELGAIDSFAVGLGPGSFTGLRIGVSAVKGLSFAFSKPIIGIPSLDVIVLNAMSRQQHVCPIIDAKQNKVYACIYKLSDNKIIRQSNYLLEEIDSVLNKIKHSTTFIGDGICLYEKNIKRRLGRLANFTDNDSWFPRAGNLVLLAKQRYNRLKKKDPKKIVPMYLFPKECQIRKKK